MGGCVGKSTVNDRKGPPLSPVGPCPPPENSASDNLGRHPISKGPVVTTAQSGHGSVNITSITDKSVNESESVTCGRPTTAASVGWGMDGDPTVIELHLAAENGDVGFLASCTEVLFTLVQVIIEPIEQGNFL